MWPIYQRALIEEWCNMGGRTCEDVNLSTCRQESSELTFLVHLISFNCTDTSKYNYLAEQVRLAAAQNRTSFHTTCYICGAIFSVMLVLFLIPQMYKCCRF